MKTLHRQIIPESSCVRKKTVDIGNLIKSRNSDRKVIQLIRKSIDPPTRIRKWNQLSQFR